MRYRIFFNPLFSNSDFKRSGEARDPLSEGFILTSFLRGYVFVLLKYLKEHPPPPLQETD